jgi:hypothetical protein
VARDRSALQWLAGLVAVLAAAGLLRELYATITARGEMMRRAHPSRVLESLLQGYSGNFGSVVGFSLLFLVLSIHFIAVAEKAYRRAPFPSLLAGLYLGGSVLMGLLVGIEVLKVNEYALQAAAGAAQQPQWYSPEQREWLHDGVNFLLQNHLVFVSGWFLFTGVGLAMLGWAAVARMPGLRWAGGIAAAGGVITIAGVYVRMWMPAAADSRLVTILAAKLTDVGMATGLLGSGILGWWLEREAREGLQQPKAGVARE